MLNAQEAYQNSLRNIKDVDITDILCGAANQIKDATEKGYFVTHIGPIWEPLKAEKAAIELQNGYGYAAGVTGAAPINENGVLKIPYYITLNWKFLPLNTRESYL